MHKRIISEHILEVRFPASINFFNKKTELVNRTMDLFGFKHWKYTQNRIDVYDTPKLEESSNSIFFSFINAGIVCIRPPDPSHFLSMVKNFRKILEQLPVQDFKKPQRVGVKSSFLHSYDKDFDSLLKIVKEKYLRPYEETDNIYNATITDIGASINFESNLGSFRTTCGPMQKSQTKEFFRSENDIPEVGLCFIIDFYKLNQEFTKLSDLEKLMSDFYNREWELFDKITKLLISEKINEQKST